MNQSTAFRRKIVYLVILVATLVPLYLLGQPSNGTTGSGGQLATMREEFGIAESDLGEISPASETMKLASLGLRGVAATLLWEKAHEYRVLHEWDRLKAALNNIALLQPHYDKVWEHQAHNLAYNVSIEFDDYRQRYEMVREGTEFLTRGVKQNQKAPRLIWYTGWFYGQKMGMSDEKRQFRRLFADDEILHDSLNEEGIPVDEALGPLGKPDNWLVGRQWLNRGYDMVDAGVKIRRQTPLNFFETGPKWSFKHAEAIESEGILDQNAEVAWTKASEDWERFGQRSIPTTSSFTIKLGGIDDLIQQIADKDKQFQELAGDTYEKAYQKNLEALSPDLRRVIDQAPEERTEAAKKALPGILASIRPKGKDLLSLLPASKQLPALKIIDEVEDLQERINKTDGYRTQINYVYWKSLAQAEQEERTVRARKMIYDAEKANADAELDRAISLYEKAFAIWADIFDDYPILTIDDSAEDLFRSVRRYMIAIDSQELPEDFPLLTFADMMRSGGGINSAELYERVRNEQQELTAKRQKELEEEERRLEEEAAAAEKAMAEKAAAEKAKAEKEAAEKAMAEKQAAEKAKAEKEAAEKAKAEKEAAEKAMAEKEAAEKAKAEKEAAEKAKAEKEAAEKAKAEKEAAEKAESEKADSEEKSAEENMEEKDSDKPADENPTEEKPADEAPEKEEPMEEDPSPETPDSGEPEPEPETDSDPGADEPASGDSETDGGEAESSDSDAE